MTAPDDIYRELVDAARRSALVIFEATPELTERTIVHWPEPSDAAGFVEAGFKAGASVLYVDRFSVDDDQVDAVAGRLGPGHQLVAELTGRHGDTTVVTAMWVLQGIGHVLVVLADWYGDLSDLIETAADALADQASAGQRASHEALVAELANLPGFATATNDAGRTLVVDQHLEGALQFVGGSTLVQEVKDYFNVRIRPGLEEAAAARAYQLLAENQTKKQVAGTLGIGATKLDQLLVRYPKPGPSS